jgi:hypothetical protein|tara:strand:+ start:9479 stop:11503 length:2025 start_codon:yes stop_codon:yes gene_type:complete
MTTENDELGSLIQEKGASVEKIGVTPRGSDDPSGQYPRHGYWFEPSINKAARGAKRNELKLNGGVENSDDGDLGGVSDSTKNNVNESESGHVIEIDDTPSGERILIRHRTGAGIEMRADGTIVINTTSNRITVVQGDDNIQVEGNANIQYNGDLNVEVTGDYNIDVAGNYNVYVAGNVKEGIDGSHRTTVRGAGSSTVLGARSETTKGPKVVTQLSGVTDVVKGNRKIATEGELLCSASGQFKMTSETQLISSSPDINMAAENLSMFGDTGTFGGENMILYAYNAHIGHTVWSETMNTNVVYGDLEGTAAKAVSADTAESQSYADPDPGGGVGSSPGYTVDTTAVDTKATAIPTLGILTSYLGDGAYGVQAVKVDIDDHLINALDKTVGTGNVTNKPLTTGEVRSKLRDNGTLNNTEFTASQIAAGKLNPEYPTATPGSVGRIAGQAPSRTPHQTILGPVSSSRPGAQSTFTPHPRSNGAFLPDSIYNPENAKVITAGLPLAKGITLGRFLGGKGEKTNLNHLTSAQKRQVSRNFAPQAEAIASININDGAFKNNRLIVLEGLYKQGASEKLEADSLNSLATKGQVVVYQLNSLNGKIDIPGMFDMAVYWKDNLYYDQLILDYDKYDPSGILSCQVIVVMPSFPADFKVNFKKEIKTLFNGNVQSANSLVEIKS